MAIIVSETSGAEEKDVASESGHWYDWSGTPQYTIVGKNGKERPTTLRDGRKNNWLPSVTTILRCVASPGLDRWKQEQVLLAALTLTRGADETDESFIDRVLSDSRETGRKAADRGTALHGAIERWLISGGKEFQGVWQPHVDATYAACLEVGVDLLKGEPERSFAHTLGYAGKIDWSSSDVVLDFKSKAKIDKNVKGYDEHIMQLAAYDTGLGGPHRRMLNIFVGCDDCAVKVVEWDEDDAKRGRTMFFAALDLWQAKTGYVPKRPDVAVANILAMPICTAVAMAIVTVFALLWA